jgi:hypothetical protein
MKGADDRGAEEGASQVLEAFGEAGTRLGAFVNRLVEDEPAVAVGAAVAAGFLAGGGLVSPLGTRATALALRAAAGNLASLVVVDVLRRAIDDGGDDEPRPRAKAK